MRTIWQGTDSLLLVKLPKQLTLIERYYAIKLRLFASLCDKFATEHYCCGILVADNLKMFGMKKKLVMFQTPIDQSLKVEKIPHWGFNVLYYFPKKVTDFRKWIYGYDIFIRLKESIPNAIFIVADGTKDMREIYPIVDLLIRPNRHDGDSRMVRECELNDIPHIYTLENPSFEYFKTQIEYEINNKINKGPGRL